MITINSLEEMQPYYNEEINTYVFNDSVKFYIDISIAWNITALDITAGNITALDITALDINAGNITAGNITALDITAGNITALDITADNITAKNISYYAVCVAYNDIVCNSIKGRRKNSKHFALDGKVTIKGE